MIELGEMVHLDLSVLISIKVKLFFEVLNKKFFLIEYYLFVVTRV